MPGKPNYSGKTNGEGIGRTRTAAVAAAGRRAASGRPDGGRPDLGRDRIGELREVLLEPRRERSGGAVVSVLVRPGSAGIEHIRRYVGAGRRHVQAEDRRSEEHTSELQSLMRISYAVFCLKKKKT